MEPIIFYEIQILRSNSLINEFEVIRQDTDDPKEKFRCKREIEEQWDLIKEYLNDYIHICAEINYEVHPHIKQILLHFPELFALNFSTAYGNLKKNISIQDAATLERMTNVFFEFGEIHNHLMEWKEVHNYSQEITTSLFPLKGEIESYLQEPQRFRRNGLLGMWNICRQQIQKLESFSRNLKYIAIPYSQNDKTINGPKWIISMLVMKKEVDNCIYEDDLRVVYNTILELWDITFDILYLADKELREKVNLLQVMSSAMIGSIQL